MVMQFYCTDLGLAHSNFSRSFDNDKYFEIEKAVSKIRIVSNELDHSFLLNYNIDYFLENIENAASSGVNKFTMINCIFLNWLNSFYSWKSYHNHFFRDLFVSKQEEYRDNYIEYRLADALRNFSTHDGFAITSIEYDVINETQYYNINPKSLLENAMSEKMNAKLKQWLIEKQNSNTQIDAYMFTKRFYGIYRQLQEDIWSDLVNAVHSDLYKIHSVLPKTYSNIYNISIISNNEEICLPVGRIISNFLDKAKNQYPQFIPNV